MKILKIRFENIHSLKGEHEIDFGTGILAEAGLFAITGPTGSGKSTLLDVITLALYNQIARVNTGARGITERVLEDDGGIMTRNMTSCYAEVEYRANGKEYRSHWSIERNKNNNLKSRKQELVDIQADILLDEGTNTPKKNEEIIGLSYEQFVKAMVLSQGEFSKLLQAPRNERNKLLEDITGAKSYREIGRAVYQRFRGVERNIELKNAGLETIELLSAEVIADKKAELKTLNDYKPEVEKSFQNASEKIKTRKELQEKQAEQKELETEKEKLKNDLKIFEPYKVELEKHDKLSKYAENLRAFDIVLKEVNQLNDRLCKLEKSKLEAESLQKLYLKLVSELIKDEVEISNANQQLEVFRTKITKLQGEEEKKKREAALYQNQLNSYVRNINQLGYDLIRAEKIEVFKPHAESFRNTIAKAQKISGVNSLKELDSVLDNRRKSNEKAGELLTKKDLLLKVQTNLKTQKGKLETAEKNLKTDSDKITSISGEVTILKKEVENLEKTLEKQRKHQSLAVHRLQLNPDEPCPLCGSTHHPYATQEPYFDIKEELLKEKKKSLQTKSNHLITLGEKNKFQLKEIENLKATINTQGKEENQYLEEIKILAKELEWDYKEDLDALKIHRNNLIQHIKEMEKSKKAFQADSILKDLNKSLQLWETSLNAYFSLNEKRTTLYEGQDINEKSNKLSSQITHSLANISSLKSQIKDHSKKLKANNLEKGKKEEELNAIVLKEQLENVGVIRASILPEERASRIRKRENELKEQKTRISEKNNALQKSLKSLTDKDDDTLSSEKLESLFEESKKQWDSLSENIGKITQSLEKDEKEKLRHRKILEELNRLKKDLALWKTMNDLIGDATGNKFSNFVQDLTLEQLIGFTNMRLSDFSDRYIMDIPTAEEVGKSDTLKVIDKYMGNARRSVHTLSGGETFLVSLAMAFALSDIAARNVKIESLFIDEGFGTLDPETLDQAITILEKMQHEGDRSVGIISHVGALKERITTQIQLVKGSLGYSTIKITQ